MATSDLGKVFREESLTKMMPTLRFKTREWFTCSSERLFKVLQVEKTSLKWKLYSVASEL